MLVTRAKRRATWSETMEKFDANHSETFKVLCSVQEIHWPDRQIQHSNLGQSNNLPIMCILSLQCGRFIYFGLVGSHSQLYTFHALINFLQICFTFTPDIEWSKQLGTIKMACCKACHGQLVTRSVTWCQHHAEVQTSQSDAIRSIKAYSWTFLHRPKTVKLRSVGELCLA